jgi:hypothetical protein
MKKLLLISLVLGLSSNAFAGVCSLTTTRTACPGKEAEMLKPYDGKNPTTETDAKATTEDACKAAGEKAAKIQRKGVLSKKSVKISFDGKDLGEPSTDKECK